MFIVGRQLKVCGEEYDFPSMDIGSPAFEPTVTGVVPRLIVTFAGP